ncbi:MAG: hypothetical protein WDN28_03480 [Chthoniobacter sp.]
MWQRHADALRREYLYRRNEYRRRHSRAQWRGQPVAQQQRGELHRRHRHAGRELHHAECRQPVVSTHRHE